jgi:dihydroorotase-like cyclic amidohydrolase
VLDDPDAVFKAVVCSSGTTIASGALAMIGTNLSAINNTGNTATGNSKNAVLAPTNTPVTTTLPLRMIDVVPDTAVSLGTATFSSGTTTLTVSALPFALPVGTDVAVVTTNGQIAQTGSFVDTAAAAGATSVVLNQAATFTLNSGVYTSTVVFTQYPEILVKLNQGLHGYYSATGA